MTGTLQGHRVVVVGLGRSGRAACRLALREGAEVCGVDRREDLEAIPGARLELGAHRRATFLDADLIVVSPGVPASQPDLVAAREAGVEVVGELGFAARYLTAPIVAVTGTNGKSTVVSFTGTLLKAAGLRTFVGGNFGVALSEAVLEGGHDIAVVEVSSYQMELPGAFRPSVAVVLNLTPDHLARHGTMDGYAAAKCTLFQQMGPDAFAVLPDGDERLLRAAEAIGGGRRGWIGAHPGVRCDGEQAVVCLADTSHTFALGAVRVPGRHNRDHAATALMLCVAMGVEPAALQRGLAQLEALPHRMEPVAESAGVLWVNDSKATNLASAEVGIGGMGRPAVVLLGGRSKGAGFVDLAPALRRHPHTIAFGEAAAAIVAELASVGLSVHRVAGMTDAMVLAEQLAEAGQAVLLSPACSSFDEFDNFEQRGDVFRTFAQARSA